ncbi:hypothetical protein MNBD_BACTEROID05-870 [hydrothermal vent metagenome]|uniref:RNA polymerase ECF-type sigma factor n=1 Tax=hydrothermal vent metagenome TaxID=652676 RepID=A0A3B0TKR3_9ZZZZ
MNSAKIKFTNGDKIKLKELYDSFFIYLCAYSEKYVSDSQISGDIVQEIFIKIWNRNKDFTSLHALRSFMYLSVRNASLNYLRDNGKTVRLRDYHTNEKIFDRNLIIEEEVYAMIRKEIDKLPKACKKVFELTLLDMSILEISESLGISKNTVRNQRAKARKILKGQLKHLYFLLFF